MKDRTVLKVYETDVQGVPPSPSRSPKVRSGARGAAGAGAALYGSGHDSDSSTRSAPAGAVPRSPMHQHRQYNDVSTKDFKFIRRPLLYKQGLPKFFCVQCAALLNGHWQKRDDPKNFTALINRRQAVTMQYISLV